MGKFLFLPGLLLGLVLGIVVMMYVRTGSTLLSSIGAPQPKPMVHCGNEVDTTGWKTYQNLKYGFEVRYPSNFGIQETDDHVELASANQNDGQDPITIVFEMIKGPLAKQLMPEMHQAGWKIADRQVYAMNTSYYTNDDQSLSTIYLFVRDFPLHEDTGNYTMIRATITTGQSEFLAAKKAKVLDFESIMTTPEQVLSTFRFLQYDELPGRDTGRAAPY